MRLVPVIALLALALPAAAQTASGGWDPAPRTGVPVTGNGAAIAFLGETRLFVVAGDGTGAFHEYNATTATWTRRADLPANAVLGSCATTAGGKIWVMNGGTAPSLYVFDPALGTWAGKAGSAITMPSGDAAMTSVADTLYLLTGSEPSVPGGSDYRSRFYSWDTKAGGPWTSLPAHPLSGLTVGVSLAAIGGEVYAALGLTGTSMYRFTAAGKWSHVDTFNSVSGDPDDEETVASMYRRCAIAPDGNGGLILHSGEGSVTAPIYWLRDLRFVTPGATTGSQYFADVRRIAYAPWSTMASTGNGRAAPVAFAPTSKRLYLVRGMNTIDFAVMDLSGTTPRTLASEHPDDPITDLPYFTPVNLRGTMTGGGGQVFATAGGSSGIFRLDARDSSKGWTPLPYLSGAIGSSMQGGALAFDGSKYLYAVGYQCNLYRLDTTDAAATWETRAAYTSMLLNKAALQLVHVPANSTQGIAGEKLILLCADYSYGAMSYSVDTNSWSSITSGLPGGITEGAAAVHPRGSKYLFVLPGASPSFWAYDLAAGRWNRNNGGTFDPTDLPLTQVSNQGSSLCYPGAGRTLYAMVGGYADAAGRAVTTSSFWSYQLPDSGANADSWSRLDDLPFTSHNGASLAYPGTGSSLYALPGNGSALVIRYALPNDAPALSAVQYRLDGTTPIRSGGSNFEGGWKLRVSAQDGDSISLDAKIEWGPVGGTPATILKTLSSDGVPVELPFTVTAGTYEWTARVTDMWGAVALVSGSVSIRSTDALPTALPVMREAESDRVIASGAAIPFDSFAVRVVSVIDDPDGLGDRARLETRILNAATGEEVALENGDIVDPGTPSEARVEIREAGDYAVRYRYADEWGYTSSWSTLGKFEVLPNGSAGDGKVCSAVAGTPGLLFLGLAMLALKIRR